MAHDEFDDFFAESEPSPLAPEQLAGRKKKRLIVRITAGGVALALLITGALYANATLTAELPTASAAVKDFAVQAGSPITLQMPAGNAVRFSMTGGEAFVAMTGESELSYESSGADATLPMMSLSKLITALVILDAKPLTVDNPGPTLTFSRAQYKVYDKYFLLGATTEKMGIGSSMSQKDAMAVMLVASASNYAEVLSTWAYGSQSSFVAAAQRWLRAHGMNSTTFVEPTGIDARNTSTASDLMVLAGLVLANPVLAEVVASPSYPIDGWGVVNNRNPLVAQGVIDGIKTGTLSGHGSNLMFAATINVGIGEPVHLVGVILGSSDQSYIGDNVKHLIADIKAMFPVIPVIKQGDIVGSYSTAWGAKTTIIAASGAGIRRWASQEIAVQLDAKDVADAAPGDIVGTATFTAGPASQTIQLTVDKALEPPSELWRLTHPGELLGW